MKAGLGCGSAEKKDLEFPNEGLRSGSVIEMLLPDIQKALGSIPHTTKKGGGNGFRTLKKHWFSIHMDP